MEDQPETYHLFGDLFVADPQRSLLLEDQALANRAISLIRNIEPATDRRPWDILSAHQRLVSSKVSWWRAKNVERPEDYIVRPSGSLDASVACLLFNPTFSVKDPCLKETFDLSNATISQMARAGFNTENALFIDQVARRDISHNVEAVYPEDLWEIHEKFLKEVWDNMRAVVVICWGSAVRKRLLGTPKRRGWFQDFEIMKLWGRYCGIDFFLELNPSKKSMKRFVIFVKHPSYFFYIQSDKDCARKLRREQGRPQDLALEVAAKLSGITIEPQFYEHSHMLRVNLCVPREVTKEREAWKGEAAAQLQCAFPSAVLSQLKSHRSPRRRDPKSLDEVVLLMEKFDAGEVCVDGPFIEPGSSGDSTEIMSIHKSQCHRRLQKINDFWRRLKEIIGICELPAKSTMSTTGKVESFLVTMDDMDDSDGWQDLPVELMTLIQDQTGLRFNKEAIDSRQGLEKAYALLHCDPGKNEPPNTLGITNLAVSVLFAYGKIICKERKPQMKELLIFREAPYDVLPRRCSGCDQQVLDDPFPYWCKAQPKMYVSWAVAGGCGNPECGFTYPSLKPYGNVTWSTSTAGRVNKEAIDNSNARKIQNPATWLLRNEAERGNLPGEIEVKCPACPRTKLVQAKWTIQDEPTLLIPYLLCGVAQDGCGSKGFWTPIEKFRITRQPALTRLWAQFAKNGCILSKFPRDGKVIFGRESIAFRIAKLKQLKMGNSPQGC